MYIIMKKRKLFMMLALFIMGVVNTFAQDVTIRSNNGSMIPAVKNGGSDDTFFKCGGCATWQHEQLSMVLTASDGTVLTQNGQLDNPANNLFESNSGNYIQIGKGQYRGNGNYTSTGDNAPSNITFVSLSLPKGYRFTGYNIKFSKSNESKYYKDLNGRTSNESFQSDITVQFGETGSDFNSYITSNTVTSNGGAVTISRQVNDNNKMGNVLYFKLQAANNPTNSQNRALITLESAQIFFTAEENYAPVTPASSANNVSAVDIPFYTSKVDYGQITRQNYNNRTRISYSSANVTDLEANFTLYEAESIKDDTHFDGTKGKVVEYKTGSISTNGAYFKVGGVKDADEKDKEQVYFIESPTYVELSNGTKNPVGYRIVGATLEYDKGSQNKAFYIQYNYNGTDYYLGTNGFFSTTPTTWEIDNEGYISSNGSYLYWNNGRAATQTEKPDENEQFSIADNGRIYQTNYSSYYIRFFPYGDVYYGLITPDDYGYYATANEITTQSTDDSWYLYVYDKEGKNPQEIKVTGHGTYPLTGLNNDAVKFGVKGTGLVRAKLTLQALDPYLYTMKVICNDSDVPAIKLDETFTATDFSVSGGEFFFHVPSTTENVNITFEDLNSNYFDETYDGGSTTHTSRINFVNSLHNQEFGKWETKSNNIYSNITEAAADKSSVKERLKVGVVGTAKFKFNNADEVGTSGGTLTEYPFTFAKYEASPNNGSFSTMNYAVTAQDQVRTRYVFTTDETRYNIAPTTAVQHRAYAFYEMKVHVQSVNYDPKFKFTKIYDNSLYIDDDKNTHNDAFYGVEVTASYNETVNGQTVTKPGYAATDIIFQGIKKIIETTKVDDFGNTDLPTASTQILYLDFSKLKGVYEITTQDHHSMDEYSATNAKNCLIFLPMGQSAPNDNTAYLLDDGVTFRAANNIVITDQNPFYSPYDITVPGEKWVQYDRKVTPADGYANVSHASVLLPFTITLGADGQFQSKDKDGNNVGSPFKLSTMNSGDALAMVKRTDSNYDYLQENVAYFTELAANTTTEANKPYMVTINGEQTDNYNFYVRAKGSDIKATPASMNDNSATNGIFTGDTSSGKVDGTEYILTPTGTFMGMQIDKASEANPAVFYFSKDCFVTTKTLAQGRPLLIPPFRSYYTYPYSNNAKMTSFRIVFGENEEMGGTNGINDLRGDADLAVIPGKGVITLVAKIDKDVTIHAVNGQTVDKCNLKAGETRTVAVPAGVYVINGVKMVVK